MWPALTAVDLKIAVTLYNADGGVHRVAKPPYNKGAFNIHVEVMGKEGALYYCGMS